MGDSNKTSEVLKSSEMMKHFGSSFSLSTTIGGLAAKGIIAGQKLVSDIGQTIYEVKRIQNVKDIELLTVLIKETSISCRHCNSLAAPIFNTDNSYKCIKCARQFHEQRHLIKSRAIDVIRANSLLKEFVDPTSCYEEAILNLSK